MHEPTPDLVRRFSAFLLAHFGARLFDKRTARGMKATAALLERLGVADAQFFLEQQPTTLGKRIYVPFALGVPDGSWPLWRQMVTLVHECQHGVVANEASRTALSWLSKNAPHLRSKVSPWS